MFARRTIIGISGPASAWATCSAQDRGSPHSPAPSRRSTAL